MSYRALKYSYIRLMLNLILKYVLFYQTIGKKLWWPEERFWVNFEFEGSKSEKRKVREIISENLNDLYEESRDKS